MPVLAEKKQGVLCLTLNRLERANALSGEMIEALLGEIRKASAASEVRVITLTGAGSSFCAGADTSELSGPEGPKKAITAYLQLVETVAGLEKPFLIGVNGPAVGGGVGLAALGDMVIASETAHFRTPELRLGLFPFIISPILVPIIGKKRFFEMVYTGQPVSARTAREWGLVNEVVTPQKLEERLRVLADEISQAPLSALTRGKRAILKGLSFPELGQELQELAAKR